MRLEKILGVQKCSRDVQVRPQLVDMSTVTFTLAGDIESMEIRNKELQKKS